MAASSPNPLLELPQRDKQPYFVSSPPGLEVKIDLLANMPLHLLIYISSFYPNHLELRSISSRFDVAIKHEHSECLCTQHCAVTCSVSELAHRTSRLVWLGNLILDVSMERTDGAPSSSSSSDGTLSSSLCAASKTNSKLLSGFKSLKLTMKDSALSQRFVCMSANSLISLFSMFEAPSSLEKLEFEWPYVDMADADWSALLTSSSALAFANLTHLTLPIKISNKAVPDEALRSMATAPPSLFAKLQHFSFHAGCVKGPETIAIIRCITSAPVFAALESLELAGILLGSDCVQALSSSSSVLIHSLKTFNIKYVGSFEPGVTQELIASPIFSRMNSFTISHHEPNTLNEGFREMMESLIHAPNLSNLKCLKLERLKLGRYDRINRLDRTNDYFESLSTSPYLSSLSMLDLCGADFFDLSKLFSSPYLTNLETLRIASSEILPSDLELACDASTFSLTKLTELHIGLREDKLNSSSAHKAIDALSKLPQLSSLKSFQLSTSATKKLRPFMTNSDINLLCSSPWVRNLLQLSLPKCETPLETPFFGNASYFPFMKRLILDGNEISLECAKLLSTISKCCPSLISLSLSYCRLNPSLIEAITTDADLHSIEEIDLSRNEKIGFKSYNMIANCSSLCRLSSLKLSATADRVPMEPDQYAQLFDASCLTNLQSISAQLRPSGSPRKHHRAFSNHEQDEVVFNLSSTSRNPRIWAQVGPDFEDATRQVHHDLPVAFVLNKLWQAHV